MHHGGPPPARRHGAGAREERGLTETRFIGSWPRPDFRLEPALPEIAFLGRSNVGKSSLLNAITGRRALARTSQSPGKTQTINVYGVADRYYLVDLPGYGYARASRTERRRFVALLRDYLSSREPLAGVVWLLDVRRDPVDEDREMANHVAGRGVPILVAITKADKFGRGRRIDRRRAILDAIGIPEEQCVLTSARTRDGIQDLRDAIEHLVAS
jgi:GTP-binding protein